MYLSLKWMRDSLQWECEYCSLKDIGVIHPLLNDVFVDALEDIYIGYNHNLIVYLSSDDPNTTGTLSTCHLRDTIGSLEEKKCFIS